MKRKRLFYIFYTLICLISIFVFKDNFIRFYKRVSLMIIDRNINTLFDCRSDFYTSSFNNFIAKIGLFFINLGSHFNSFNIFINSIISFFGKILVFLSRVSIFICYAIEIFFFGFLFLKFSCLGSNKSFKVSSFSKGFIFIHDKMEYLIYSFKSFVHFFWNSYKKEILILSFIYLLFCGYFQYLALEIIIWLLNFIVSLFTFSSPRFIFKLLMFIVVLFIGFFASNPLWINVLICLGIFYLITIKIGYTTLQRNKYLRQAKVFNKAGVLNLLNGPPSSGKTLSNVVFSLDAEEIFINELQEEFVDFEQNYPSFNLALLFGLCYYHFGLMDQNDFEELISSNDSFLEQYSLIEKNLLPYFDNEEFQKVFSILYSRGTMLASNYGMVEPYFVDHNDFSHAANMDSFRWYKKMDSMWFEPYCVLSLQELDKEFNSHDSKKEISDEGTAAAFAIISHACERHVYVFADYQLKDQVPKRIRGIASLFITIESKKNRIPFFIGLYRNIAYIFLNFYRKYIISYKFKTYPSDERSMRNYPFIVKRNTVNFFFQFAKYRASFWSKIYDYFNYFSFFEIKAKSNYKDTDNEGDDFSYFINCCELNFRGSKLYESCNFKDFYQELKIDTNHQSDCLSGLVYWPSLAPGYKFYTDYVHQHFYNKVVEAQMSYESSSDSSEVISLGR